MVRFRGTSKACALPAALLVLVAGCGTAHGQAAHRTARAGQSRLPRPGPAPSATGEVKRADSLTGVTCLPTGTCVAAGWYYYGATGQEQTLGLRWNGHAWLAQPTPSRGHDSQLDDVSCATVLSCLAVGTPAEAWTGTRWSVVPGPPGGAMSSVSCPAPGSCQAVGWRPAGSRPVAAHWNGRAWLAERVPRPKPAPQTLTLAAVSCPAPSFCMAVGDDSHGAKTRPSPSYRDLTLVERWNGSRWRIIPAPSPTYASRLTGVSCPAPDACVAVGSSANGARTLAERWNGARWTVQHTPDIGHIGYSALTAVSCATAASCMAVGTYNDGVSGIAERWDGTRWTIRRLPVPPVPPGEESSVDPASVSCTSATACTTVGTTQNQTMAERWNGGTWTVQRTPNPT
jgi:hypothetical protein